MKVENSQIYHINNQISHILAYYSNDAGDFYLTAIQRYKDTDSVSDKPRSGRTAFVMTPRMRKIVKGNEGEEAEESKGLIDRFDIQGIDHVLFSDEKLFTIEEAYNQQNDRILSPTASTIPEEYRYVKRLQKLFSVMVWDGISSLSRSPIVFIPTRVIMYDQTYQNLVLKPIVKDPSKYMFNNESFLFQQDGAPAHTANTTKPGFTPKFLTVFPNRNGLYLVRTLTL
ncbi:hypothetical protein LOD99_12440 [Oopsacas minuta]|uniref:Uncharacterized protein n=1 Tax=Oopsacas minuta TaxID=111878 RepID=A0AAV7JF79_9METZ|nr:hypothetical protein LOD99_12440 [Oopsacas minuta]